MVGPPACSDAQRPASPVRGYVGLTQLGADTEFQGMDSDSHPCLHSSSSPASPRLFLTHVFPFSHSRSPAPPHEPHSNTEGTELSLALLVWGYRDGDIFISLLLLTATAQAGAAPTS